MLVIEDDNSGSVYLELLIIYILSLGKPPPEIQVTLQAIVGLKSYRTLCLVGCYKYKHFNLLVDSGTTYNFLDKNTARQLNCNLYQATPLWVIVANGERLCNLSSIPQFIWQLYGISFIAPKRILPLGTCDAVMAERQQPNKVLFQRVTGQLRVEWSTH